MDKKFSVHIQGCRTNQYEGEAIAALLEKSGGIYSLDDPDIIVVVSCTITAVADRKCRKLIRRQRRENPDALIVACGCYAQNMSASEREALGVDILIGNRMKYMIPELVSDWFKKERKDAGISIFDEDIMADENWDALLLDRPRLHTRAFLKVQDGCSHFCSYCIVPYVRGNPVSRDVEDAFAEAEKIVDSGCPEIVLTGVHLGLHEDLPLLVRRIGSIKGLKRLRFGSIEPFAVDDRLLESLMETDSFCRHLHLPLQSGDDGVLANMRRGYTSKEFRQITDNIRNKLGEDVHLSTDLMIGFPGEDEAAFENSMGFIKEIGFGKIHIFNYSPREGTVASHMTCPPENDVKKRLKKAHMEADGLHREYCSQWIGKDIEILVEQKTDSIVRGLARNYMRIEALSESAEVGDEICVKVGEYKNGVLSSDLGIKRSADNSEFPEFL